jgi:hypothetical protein
LPAVAYQIRVTGAAAMGEPGQKYCSNPVCDWAGTGWYVIRVNIITRLFFIIDDEELGLRQPVEDGNVFEIRVPGKDQLVDGPPQDDPAKHVEAVAEAGVDAVIGVEDIGDEALEENDHGEAHEQQHVASAFELLELGLFQGFFFLEVAADGKAECLNVLFLFVLFIANVVDDLGVTLDGCYGIEYIVLEPVAQLSFVQWGGVVSIIIFLHRRRVGGEKNDDLLCQ